MIYGRSLCSLAEYRYKDFFNIMLGSIADLLLKQCKIVMFYARMKTCLRGKYNIAQSIRAFTTGFASCDL